MKIIQGYSDEIYQLGASIQALDHIGSGGNSAVVRAVVDKNAPQELAIKLLDPRRVSADDRLQDNRKFSHPNLLRIEKLFNLKYLGFEHVPDWYRRILNCDPKPFESRPIANCTAPSDNLQRVPELINHALGFPPTTDKTLAEFGPDELFALVMEYCPITLSQYMKYPGSLNEISRILTQVCAELTAMHDAGIIHADLHIENILLTNEGEAKIADFGSSERWEEGDLHSNARHREDIMSLGLLAFELACGENLLEYDWDDYDETLSGRNVPKPFWDICLKAVGFESMFSSAAEFSLALRAQVA